MKKTFLLLFFIVVTTAMNAQTAVDSVKMTIDKLFRAMKSSDAVAIRECFGDSAVMQTITFSKEGNAIVKTDPVAKFASSIASLPKDAADERITYEVVKVDGALAIAWTPYKFYYNGQFSHCGVNSFQLVRFNNGWKIQYIIDTRRKQACE